MSRSPFRDPAWWRRLLRQGFGPGFWGFLAFAVLSGLACYLVLGPDAFADAVADDLEMLVGTVPRIVAALGVAGLVWVLLPRDRLTALIGRKAGWRGLVVATVAGMITPGGPASAFALVALLARAGSDRGALVAYIVAWSMLGVQRVLVWDIPFMGAEFSFARFLVSLPLPILAGLLARHLPLTLRMPEEKTAPEPPA